MIFAREHPTGLHGYQRQNDTENKQKEDDNDDNKNDPLAVPSLMSSCTKFTAEIISLSIVPVKISHPECSIEISTRALLHNGSQGTFIHNDLLQRLSRSVPASRSIKTMTGEEAEN